MENQEKTEFVCHGYLGLSNLGGVEIEINDCGDGARLRWYDGEVTDWLEIQQGENPETETPFIYYNETEYYFDEFMRR